MKYTNYMKRKVNSDDSEARFESDAYREVWGLTPQLSANKLLRGL